MATVFLIAGSGAEAAPDDNGLFELDANVQDQAPPGDDWSNIFASTDSAFTDTGIVADPAPQTIFTGGASKDDLDIPGWRHKDGSVPDKDDITDAYAAAYGQGGDAFVYFGLDRFAVQGSANVGFWFFQDDVAPQADGTFSGQHEVGDLLVLSEFSDGGTGVSIKVFEWVGTGGDEGGGTLQTLFGGATGQPADCDDTGAAANVCANVNTSPLLDADIPWDYVGKGGARDIPTAAFFEGGINLDAFFGQAPCFTNVVAETRSSFEVNAVLKDFVHSQFELCNANISIAPDDVNEVGDSHTFTVDVNKSIAGNNTPADDGTIVDVTLTDANGGSVAPTTDTCASPGTSGGSCEVTFSSDVAGLITGHAEADVAVGDTTIHVETDGTGDNSDDALKRFVDGRVSISPDDVNDVGDAHTFIVSAEQNTGSGFVAATDGHVDVTLTDAGGAVNQIDAAASTCDDSGDNLDANGQCTITFTSNTAGTVTGHATVDINITTPQGNITITRQTDGVGGNSGDAVKRFVDGRVSIEPDDVNDVGDSHTFVVTAEQNTGSGFVAATDGHVDVTLTDADGAVNQIDAAASTCDDAGDNLDANGQCTITFTSNTAGTVTGHATVDINITTPQGNITITRQTDNASGNSDDALKRFVDGRVSISPDDVNDVGDSHTFVVTAEQNTGSGFGAATDGHVDVTLTDADGAVNQIDAAASTCDDAGDNLDANGQCTITFTSNTAGTVTGHATVDINITTPQGNITITRQTNGVGGNSGDAVKRFVDGRVSISPDDVNGIGESHTFTVTAEQNTGSGFVAATDGHADVTLTDAGGAVNQIDAAASTCDDAGDNLDTNGQCTITFTSNTAGTVTGHATVDINITTPQGNITITRQTNGVGGNSGDAVKEFVDGSLAWFKDDDTGTRLGGATFEVCRTHDLDTSTNPDTFVDITPDVCVTVLDNSAPDANPADGEFLLEDLKLGRYTVDEVAPFPPGFEPDPDVVTAELTLEPGPKDVTISEPFVNRALFRLIVITCNTSTEKLVDSTVTLNGDTRETVKPGQLGGIDETALCTLPGANYDNLPRGNYNPNVELPDIPPLFPGP